MPLFFNEVECLSLIRDFLSNDSKLVNATNKYRQKCSTFEDSNYIKKVKTFIDYNKNENFSVNIPIWYEFIFFKKNLMLRFRSNKLKSFFSQVFDSVILTKYRYKILIPLFLIYSIFSSIIFLFKFPIAKLKI